MTKEDFINNLQNFAMEDNTVEELNEKAQNLLVQCYGKQNSYVQTLLYDYVSNMRTLHISKVDFFDAMKNIWE